MNPLEVPCVTCPAPSDVKCDPVATPRRRRSGRPVDYSNIDLFGRLGDWVWERGNAWIIATVRR